MMLKKVFAVSCCLMLVLGLTACGGNVKPSIEDQTREEADKNAPQAEVDTSWFAQDGAAICSGVYVAGKDIAPGRYTFASTDNAHVTVFKSVDAYEAYHTADRFTVGEEGEALEKNALSNEYLYGASTLAVNLKDGYVLMIDGRGSLESASGTMASSDTVTGSQSTAASGMYLSGDIPAGSYMLTCTQLDEGYTSLELVVFEDMAAYDEFMACEQFTVGEFQDAVEQCAWSEFYLEEGETYYVNVTDETCLLLDNGTGTLTPVNMGWAV